MNGKKEKQKREANILPFSSFPPLVLLDRKREEGKKEKRKTEKNKKMGQPYKTTNQKTI